MATVSERFIVVEGPRKKEVLNLTAISDADTVTSQLQNPSFGQFVQTDDGGDTSLATNVAISGRTVTLNNANFSSSAGVLTIYGF